MEYLIPHKMFVQDLKLSGQLRVIRPLLYSMILYKDVILEIWKNWENNSIGEEYYCIKLRLKVKIITRFKEKYS